MSWICPKCNIENSDFVIEGIKKTECLCGYKKYSQDDSKNINRKDKNSKDYDNYDPNICWFCEERAPSKEASENVGLLKVIGEIESGGMNKVITAIKKLGGGIPQLIAGGQIIAYESLIISVPRCQQCQIAQYKINNRGCLFGLIIALVGPVIGWAIAHFVIGSAVAYAIAIPLGFLLGGGIAVAIKESSGEKKCREKGIKPFSFSKKYPEVLRSMSEGWLLQDDYFERDKKMGYQYIDITDVPEDSKKDLKIKKIKT